MDRRKSLKLIATGAVAVPAVMAGCATDDKKETDKAAEPVFNLDRNPDEVKYEKEILQKVLFLMPMNWLRSLFYVISSSRKMKSAAVPVKPGVPDFIDFIVRDMPITRYPYRVACAGWICNASNDMKRRLKIVPPAQQIELVDHDCVSGESKTGDESGGSVFQPDAKSDRLWFLHISDWHQRHWICR
jgi:gluconate 2-dehydrogenase gamma chain